MCGIVGYVGPRSCVASSRTGCAGSSTAATTRPAWPSSGTAGSSSVAAVGQARRTSTRRSSAAARGHIGIGHTRWATHGRPSDGNAHPHSLGRASPSCTTASSRTTWSSARQSSAAGMRSRSETDTEIVAHLIDDDLKARAGPRDRGPRGARARCSGAYAIAVRLPDERRQDRGRRNEASPARRRHRGGRELPRLGRAGASSPTPRMVVFLEDGEMAV